RRTEQAGGDTVESADVKAVVITVAVSSPPIAPQDVSAVVVPAASGAPSYVSLSWAITNDANVAGYAIYRSEVESTQGTRVNEGTSRAPTYRDQTVAAGRRYLYRVTAIGPEGQESDASTPVEVQIPAAQP